jgi:hypothetical protein
MTILTKTDPICHDAAAGCQAIYSKNGIGPEHHEGTSLLKIRGYLLGAKIQTAGVNKPGHSGRQIIGFP